MKNSKTMSEVEFLGIEIVIDGNHLESEIDLGGVELSLNGRSYFQDIIQSHREFDNGQTTIRCDLMTDEDDLRDIFDEDCNFDLTPSDLHSKLDTATVYIASDPEPEHQTLFVRFNDKMTKAIDLDLD